MDELQGMFLHEKPTLILVELFRSHAKESYASLLAKRADCTYSHTAKILNVFKKYGVVSFEKKGRKKIVQLTDEGKKVAKRMYDMTQHLENLS